MNLYRLTALPLIVCAVSACAGAQHPASSAPPSVASEAPRPTIYGGEFMVVGNENGQGDAYDATLLFERANAAVRTHRCDAALPDYERLIAQFPTSTLVPAAHYNRGVCLQSMGRPDDAIAAYRLAASGSPDASLVRDAWFRIAVVGEATQRPPLVIEAADAVLALPQAGIPDRVEALARKAAALLAERDFVGASRSALNAIQLAPTVESINALGDDEYAAEARFVLADATRQQAAAITIDVSSPDLEHQIERRVQLVIHAHVQFNDTIRVGNPHWEAAAGYTIGQMYRALYDAIVFAHMPPDWDAPAIARYRQDSGRRLRPLLQGALRAWEATLSMAQAYGIADNDWAQRAQHDVGDLRDLVVNGQVPQSASDASGVASASPAPTDGTSSAPPGAESVSSAPPSGETVNAASSSSPAPSGQTAGGANGEGTMATNETGSTPSGSGSDGTPAPTHHRNGRGHRR